MVVLGSSALASPAGCGLGRQPLGDDWHTGSDADDESDTNTLDVSSTFDMEVVFATLVDILFVVDNSPSMGEEQLNLARNLPAMLEGLEAADVRADYRIAFTTTDNGNPWCPGTTPERGAFVLSSCRSRLDEFVSGSGDDAIDVTAACLHGCPEAFTDVAIRPTTTLLDPTPKPRPWIQNDGCVSNLPEGMTAPQAMACFGPQGFRILGDGMFDCPRRGIASVVRATCERSTRPAFDCPDLP